MASQTPAGNAITKKAVRIANDLNGGQATARQIAEIADRLAKKTAK